MKKIRQVVLDDIDAFIKANPPLTPTSFGEKVARNSKLVLWLSRGRGLRTLEKIYDFMETYKATPSKDQSKEK